MQKQSGFTLIELVVVIIILGILAVTAAPKFINLQSDARASTLQGMKGALQGANSLVFSKAAIAGEEKKGSADGTTLGSVDIGTGTNATTNYGYLVSSAAQLKNALDVSMSNSETAGFDWYVKEGANAASASEIYQAGSPRYGDATKKCYIKYTPATSTTSPQYEVEDTDC
ncbi:prepilin-type N-terminal cleavage/methylation domain-containing protein [Shewanella sp. MBTL60-007]|uniref:prepilin-type N-terminal cleavage/methylation domain-containing protein n=1 Tax=Shewanella sp. MBTL60-007 TaxID=2815911 RepID=UPI001BC7348D|nr:type II secretion system protein [Shewanella sp. MBTL60-007]GIU12193.1 MSHA pilin protein MshA [Shewanella sp. MBTL60-007]